MALSCQAEKPAHRTVFQVYKFIGRQKVKDGLARWEGNNLVLNDPNFDLLAEIKANLCTDLKVGKNEVSAF